MSRKTWLILGGAALALILLVVLAAMGYLIYRGQQTRTWHERAETAFEQGDWLAAREWYPYYINRHPGDVHALMRYAEACTNIVEDRLALLNNAVVAYHQILVAEPRNEQIMQRILDIYEKTGQWQSLEHYGRQFGRQFPGTIEYEAAVAKALVEMDQTSEALDMLEDLAEEGAADVFVYDSLAEILRTTRGDSVVLPRLDEAVEAHPGLAAPQIARARWLASQGQLEKALAGLEQVLESNPDNAEARVALAEIQMAHRNWQEAEATALEVIEQDPAAIGAYLVLGRTCVRLGTTQTGIERIKSLDALVRADHPELLLMLADIFLAQQDIEGAEEAAAEYALSYPHQQPIINYIEGRILLAKGKPEEAAKLLAPTVETRPNFSPARFYLAMAYMDSGRQAQGRAELETYIELNPGDERAKLLMSQGGRRAYSLEDAQHQAEALLASDRAAPEALISTALSLFYAGVMRGESDGHVETVEALFERAIEVEPGRPIGYRALADMCAARDNPEGAMAVVDRALAAGIDRSEMLTSMAGAELAQGNLEKAKAYQAEAEQSDGYSARDAIGWANLFTQWGYPSEAAASFTRALEILPDDMGGKLRTGRIIAAGRAGEYEKGLAWLDEAAGQPGISPAALSEASLELALRMLQAGPDKWQTEVEHIAAKMEEESPSHPAALILKARLLMGEEPPRMDEAEALYNQALRDDPGSVEALVGLAFIAERRGDTSEAERIMTRVSALEPANLLYQKRLAHYRIKLGQHGPAQKVLRQILQSRPSDSQAALLLAGSAIATGRTGEARDLLDALDPPGLSPGERNTARAMRSELDMSAGETQRARTELETLHRENPGDLGIVRQLAEAYAVEGDYERGQALLENYKANHEADPQAWLAYARLLRNHGPRPDALNEATTAITRALVLQPDYLPALREQIDVQMQMGNGVDALTVARRFLELRPGDVGVLLRKAILLLEENWNLDEALAAANAALDRQPSAEAFYVKGRILLALNRNEECIEVLSAAVQQEENETPNIHLVIAQAYLDTGKKGRARAHFEQAKRLSAAGMPVNEPMFERIREEF